MLDENGLPILGVKKSYDLTQTLMRLLIAFMGKMGVDKIGMNAESMKTLPQINLRVGFDSEQMQYFAILEDAVQPDWHEHVDGFYAIGSREPWIGFAAVLPSHDVLQYGPIYNQPPEKNPNARETKEGFENNEWN